MKNNYLVVCLGWIHLRFIVSSVHSALCILTRNPSGETLEFAEALAADAVQYDLHVLVMIDDNQLNLTALNTKAPLHLLQIPNDQPRHHGFHQTTSLGPGWSSTTSWDKALFYFCVLHKQYEFLWLIEDDVFIPSVRAVQSLHQLYSGTADLVIPRNGINQLANSNSWLWPLAVGKFLPPWSCSMVNVVGLSRRMLTHIHDYVRWRGVVPFHEFFFNTLAMQHPNLSVVAPTELTGIVYLSAHKFEHVQRQPNNLWHSLKNSETRRAWRQK